jgi:hypothetical protein
MSTPAAAAAAPPIPDPGAAGRDDHAWSDGRGQQIGTSYVSEVRAHVGG